MKTKIFNVVVYSMLGWSILSAGYLALPTEYQEMIPQMNWLTALISGSSTALVGSAGLAIKSFMTNAAVQADAKYLELGQKFLELTDKYKDVQTAYTNLSAKYDILNATILKNNNLLKTELQTKLDNPLLTETSRALIEDVLNNDEES